MLLLPLLLLASADAPVRGPWPLCRASAAPRLLVPMQGLPRLPLTPSSPPPYPAPHPRPWPGRWRSRASAPGGRRPAAATASSRHHRPRPRPHPHPHRLPCFTHRARRPRLSRRRRRRPSSPALPSPALELLLSTPADPPLGPLSSASTAHEPARGRPGGRADSCVLLTAPHARPPSPSAVDAPPDARVRRPSPLSSRRGLVGAAPRPSASLAPEPLSPGRQPPAGLPDSASASTTASPRRPRRLSSARLWNPTNSTPRDTRPRKRRTSTPPAPPVPLQHPSLDGAADAADDLAAGAGDYPLLTLSEQRQTKHSPTTRASLQIEQSSSHDQRVSLPRSVRASYDGSRPQLPTTPLAYDLDDEPAAETDRGQTAAAAMSSDAPAAGRPAVRDLERGLDAMQPRSSDMSAVDGNPSAPSSSHSSVMGDDVHAEIGAEWGLHHPCYPHLNPHVPLDSPEYAATRIIRIRRNWLLQGDLAPTFSNLYPEILDPAGVSEQAFRLIIEKLNAELVPAFNPYSLRNMMDSLMGLVTGWLWDDLGFTAVKTRLDHLDRWIDDWNLDMEKTMPPEEGAMPPKIIPLRQTGYMTLDIQIPDPEIAPAPSSVGAGESRTALPLEPTPA